jgi:hypothetical protein
MAIGRMQMNRQLYGLGSYFPPENGREKFGLGSKLKKFVRKIIPNEVSEIAVKAAPFVAPFNPLLAGAMAGIGGFDQTGRIGSSLKSGLLTYGGGQLGRYIGGAGFQQGINPFAGYNPASSFGGISSLFTSPIGTQTGLQLGQYEMFGGPGSKGFKASQVTDPGIARDSIFAQPGAEGTFTYSDMGDDIINLSPGSITPSGQIVSGTAAQNQAVLDQIAKQTVPGATENVVKKATERGYSDIAKDLFSGDITARGNAAKELGGKALKDIYTTPITNQAGEIVGSKVDKTAVIATLAMIPSYLDAKKAADDAGIEEFDEAAYNAERDKYMERYKANLPASSFGIQAAANGGRIGYALGDLVRSSGVARPVSATMSAGDVSSGSFSGGSGIGGMFAKLIQNNPEVRQMFTQQLNTQPMTAQQPIAAQRFNDFIDENNDGIDDRLQAANGGRIGYREGTPREGIVSLTDEDSGVVYRDPKTGEPLTTTEFLRRAQEDEDRENQEGEDKELDYGASSITLPKKKTFRERSMEIAVPKQINRELEDKFENYLKKLVTGKKDGGRMGFMMGTEVPMRQNQGGITELDYRKTGGFVPVGVKERADDVPAMLSKNEFVFTADAVRGAGKGDINKGAKMMYAKMKALEGKVKKLKKTKKKKVKV